MRTHISKFGAAMLLSAGVLASVASTGLPAGATPTAATGSFTAASQVPGDSFATPANYGFSLGLGATADVGQLFAFCVEPAAAFDINAVHDLLAQPASAANATLGAISGQDRGAISALLEHVTYYPTNEALGVGNYLDTPTGVTINTTSAADMIGTSPSTASPPSMAMAGGSK